MLISKNNMNTCTYLIHTLSLIYAMKLLVIFEIKIYRKLPSYLTFMMYLSLFYLYASFSSSFLVHVIAIYVFYVCSCFVLCMWHPAAKLSGEASPRIHLGRTHTLKFSLLTIACMFWAKMVEQPTRIKMLPFKNGSINNRCFNRQMKYRTCHFFTQVN